MSIHFPSSPLSSPDPSPDPKKPHPAAGAPSKKTTDPIKSAELPKMTEQEAKVYRKAVKKFEYDDKTYQATVRDPSSPPPFEAEEQDDLFEYFDIEIPLKSVLHSAHRVDLDLAGTIFEGTDLIVINDAAAMGPLPNNVITKSDYEKLITFNAQLDHDTPSPGDLFVFQEKSPGFKEALVKQFRELIRDPIGRKALLSIINQDFKGIPIVQVFDETAQEEEERKKAEAQGIKVKSIHSTAVYFKPPKILFNLSCIQQRFVYWHEGQRKIIDNVPPEFILFHELCHLGNQYPNLTFGPVPSKLQDFDNRDEFEAIHGLPPEQNMELIQSEAGMIEDFFDSIAEQAQLAKISLVALKKIFNKADTKKQVGLPFFENLWNFYKMRALRFSHRGGILIPESLKIEGDQATEKQFNYFKFLLAHRIVPQFEDFLKINDGLLLKAKIGEDHFLTKLLTEIYSRDALSPFLFLSKYNIIPTNFAPFHYLKGIKNPLEFPVKYGAVRILDNLLTKTDAALVLNLTGLDGENLLHSALSGVSEKLVTQEKCEKMVELLLSKGLDPTQKNRDGFSPIDMAVSLNLQQILRKFLSKLSAKELQVQLYRAIDTGNQQTVDALLQYSSPYLLSAMHYAIEHSNAKEMIEHVIGHAKAAKQDKNMDIFFTVEDPQGNNLLHLLLKNPGLSKHKKADIACVLMKHIDAEKPNKNGFSFAQLCPPDLWQMIGKLQSEQED